MGKRSRFKGGAETDYNAELKRLRRALRSLDLVDSRLDEVEWAGRVARYVGDDAVNEWMQGGRTDHDSVYDFTYQSFAHAMHFSVGWRSSPLAAECEWMLPRLSEAISRSKHSEPFLVELGAGPGAAAAILSASLKVPIVALDSHPKSLGLAEQFAERTGGLVESRLADAGELAEVLEGKKPAAVFGLGFYGHFQPQRHTSSSFSFWADMQRILKTYTVAPEVVSLTDALSGADLLLAEMAGPEHVAEIAAGLFQGGYEIPFGGMSRIKGATPDRPTAVTAMHFTTGELPKRNPNLLIEMYSPLPRPLPRTETDDDGLAEALRLSLEPTEFIHGGELDYNDGSGRLRYELFVWKNLAAHYRATTNGFRHIKFLTRGSWTPCWDSSSRRMQL